MYIPAHFREEDLSLLQSFIREHSFGTLITCQDRIPFATHLPFLLDTERGSSGTLRAHMARANPQWHSFAAGEEALAIFQGPHAYISPSWYTIHPSVPTWNYTAVHAYGNPCLLTEEALHTLLAEIVAAYEASLPEPWLFESLSDEYVEKMARAVVGFEIEITRLEGKFKLSQNRPEVDRHAVIEQLERTGDPQLAAVAEWMNQAGAKKP